MAHPDGTGTRQVCMADSGAARYAGGMRMRSLLIAGLGLGVTVAASAVLLQRLPDAAAAPSLACPALAPRIASADRIEVVHAGRVFWVERRGQLWGLARQGGYPALPGLVERLLDAAMAARLMQPAAGSTHAGDPFAATNQTDTLVRILGTSGATLCALVVDAASTATIRRQGDTQAWSSDLRFEVPPGERGWSQTALPPLDMASMASSGDIPAAWAAVLAAGLPFADAGSAPQHHPAPLQAWRLASGAGTVTLTTGSEAGRVWLLVSGTSPWARRLAATAFAMPPDSPLAVPPETNREP